MLTIFDGLLKYNERQTIVNYYDQNKDNALKTDFKAQQYVIELAPMFVDFTRVRDQSEEKRGRKTKRKEGTLEGGKEEVGRQKGGRV